MATVSTLEVVLRGDDSQLQRTFNNADDKFNKFTRRAGRKAIGAAAAAGGAMLALGTFAVNAAVSWEASFADVRRTVEATDEELFELENTLLDLSVSPVFGALENSAATLAGIATAAGQLGVETSSIDEFTSAVAATGVATGIATDDLALFFGQFAAVTGLDIEQDIMKLADTIVFLGNNAATTETQIIAFATRLAGLATVGFEIDEILGWSTALAQLGITAEAGGTAFTTTVFEMQKAANAGGADLNTFAEIAGLTADEFAELALTDPSAAMEAFLTGLSKMEGTQVPVVLDELGLSGIRVQQSIIKLTSDVDGFTTALGLSEEGMQGNGAAMTEATIKAETTAGSFNRFKNSATLLGIELGTTLLPAVTGVTDGLTLFLSGENEAGLELLSQGFIDLATAIGKIALDDDTVDFGETLAVWGENAEQFETIIETMLDNLDTSLDEFDLGTAIMGGLEGLGDFFFGIGEGIAAGLQAGLDFVMGIVDSFFRDLELQFLEQIMGIFEGLGPEFLASLPGGIGTVFIDAQLRIDELQAEKAFDQIAAANSDFLIQTLGAGEGLDFGGAAAQTVLGNADMLAALDPAAIEALKTELETQLQEAMVEGDQAAIDLLLPLAPTLGIDPVEVQAQADEQISEAIANEVYDVEATVDITLLPGFIDSSAISAAIGNIGGTAPVGGTGGTTIINSYGLNANELVQTMNTAQSDAGNGQIP